MEEINFDDIRPYYDAEIPYAMQRLSLDENLYRIFKYLFPSQEQEKVKNIILQINTVEEMQRAVMFPLVSKLIKKTTTDVVCYGLDNLSKDNPHLFIGNHRDIVFDSALLQVILVKNNFNTTGILFGDNLLVSEIIRTIAKSNKLFIAYRGKDMKEFWEFSTKLSYYIRYQLNQLKQSVWIAQRNGRTKDGDDKTDAGVLKMLSMSSNTNFVKDFVELNITPCAISYEYEPCDFLKTFETYLSKRILYEKHQDEDFSSIITGLTQHKGNVSFSFCNPITEDEILLSSKFQKNERFRFLSKKIDGRILSEYKLWKTNYIAYDLLFKGNKYAGYYSDDEKNEFKTYMSDGINKKITEGFYGYKEFEVNELKEIFLKIYSNPLINKLNSHE